MSSTSQPQSNLLSERGSLSCTKGWLINYIEPYRLFPRNVWLFLLVLFLLNINLQIFLAMFNLYMKAVGFGEAEVGRAIASRQAGAAFFAIPIALVMPHIPWKRFLGASFVVLAASSYALVHTTSEPLVLLFSFICGVSFSVAGIASGPFIMDNTGASERTQAFSMTFGVHLIAGIIGSISSGHIVSYFSGLLGDDVGGYRVAFFVTVVSALLAIVPLAMIHMSRTSAASALTSFRWQGCLTRMSKQFKILSAHFLVALGAGLSIPFINLYFSSRFSLSPGDIGALFGVMQLFMLAGTMTSPIMSKSWGLIRSVVFTQAISIPFLLILAHGFFLPLAILAFFLRAGFMNSAVPIMGTLGMEVSEPEDRPMMQALVSTVWGVAWMISALVGGQLIETHGYALTMDITVALYLSSTIFFWLMFRKLERRSNGQTGAWVFADEEA